MVQFTNELKKLKTVLKLMKQYFMENTYIFFVETNFS